MEYVLLIPKKSLDQRFSFSLQILIEHKQWTKHYSMLEKCSAAGAKLVYNKLQVKEQLKYTVTMVIALVGS